LFLLRFCYMHTYFCYDMLHTCSCYSFVVHALVLVVPQLNMYLFFLIFLFISWPSWATFQLLTFLHCYIKLLLSFWPSCVVTMHCSLVHDLFTLLHYVVFQLLILLHYCVVLLFNSSTLLHYYVVLELLTLLCYSLVHDLFVLMWCDAPQFLTLLHCSLVHDLLTLLRCVVI
jgi:hypothetical protein